MTIKLPVRVETDENESSWWVADADGEPVDLYAIVAALNATAAAPDLTALREAATMAADRLAEICYFNGTPDLRYREASLRLHAALALFPQDGDA